MVGFRIYWSLDVFGFTGLWTIDTNQSMRHSDRGARVSGSETGRIVATDMGIRKQEFYEGAALHLVARTGGVTSIRYDAPFFLLNEQLLVLLKYSTKGRSPWGFTFTSEEQILLGDRATKFNIMLGLVCGADGVAAFSYDAYLKVASPRVSSIHIACYRRHGEYYEVNGPDGTLDGKVPPSKWKTILRPLGERVDETQSADIRVVAEADWQCK